MQNSIKIGPSFFAKEKNDYSEWRWAWVRELCQNGMDLQSTKNITFDIKFDGVNTIASCTNDGSPMTKEILVSKFLSVGESGKGFDGTVGGFGKAKVIIAFTHEHYNIRTGTLHVDGEGAQYDLTEDLPYFHGTTTTVAMAGNQTEQLRHNIRRFAAYAQWKGTLSLDGEVLNTDLRKGSLRRDLGFGTVYTNNTIPNRLIVRVNGIPMFSRYVSVDKCVIVELVGASNETMTSNRDGLVNGKSQELDEFVLELSINKRSALKRKHVSRYKHYHGDRHQHREMREGGMRSFMATVCGPTMVSCADGSVAAGGAVSVRENEGGAFAVTSVERMEAKDVHTCEVEEITRTVQISGEFVIKNETDMQVPDYYLPDHKEFSEYSKRLATFWTRLMIQMHRTFQKDGDFAIGFIFSDDECGTEAEFEPNGPYGNAYYLNPAKIAVQKNSNSRSFKKRFALTERNRLISIALHEFVHGAFGFHYHDEAYSSCLTDSMAKIMDNRSDFNWCFK